MIFNKKDTVQKNWRMVKKGKGIAFSCMLFFTAGAVVVNPVATVFNQNGVAYAQNSIRASEGAENLDYTNKEDVEGYIKISYEVDKANNVIHWTVLDNPGRKGNSASGYVYFTIPKSSVGEPTNWKVVQTDKNGKVVNTRDYWKDNDGSYLMGQKGRMNVYTGSEMTKRLTQLYKDTRNPAIKGNEAAVAAQTAERSQALYTMTADNNSLRNVMWTITYDTPIVDMSKPLDYVAGMQGTGLIGGRTNIMTGFTDNYIDNESSKFQAVAVQDKYTQKVGGSFNANPATYVTNKAGTPEFPNNYRGATTFAWKDGQAPTATTPGTYTKTVVVTYPAHYKQTPQEVTITFEVKGNEASEIQAPAKTPVQNLTNLTEDEKDKVKKAIEAANPGKVANVVVGNDGTATVTFNDGSEATLTPEKTVEKATKDADGIVNPAKTPVENPSNLTEDEKDKVKKAIEGANPGKVANVEVTPDGTATVTFKDGSVATLTPDKTVKKADSDPVKPEVPGTINIPGNKVSVDNTGSLTPEEIAKVKEEVGKVNPGKTVVVDAKGNATVTDPKTNLVLVIPAEELVKPKEQPKPTPTPTPVTPSDKFEVTVPTVKVPVVDAKNLTPAEQAAVKTKVEESNPGKTVVVDAKGNATVTDPNDPTATPAIIPGDNLVVETEKAEEAKPATPVVVNVSGNKVPVDNTGSLTPEEIAKVKEEVGKVNPGKTVVVDAKGNATVTDPTTGKVVVVPGASLVEQKVTPTPTPTPTPKQSDSIVVPSLTIVMDPTNLTQSEKVKVENEVKKSNPTATKVEVGNDGTTVVTFKDGSTATLTPSQTIQKAVVETKDSDKVKYPSVATPVADVTNLTGDEKAKVEEEVKKSNPTATKVEVGDDGTTTVTFPDGSTAVIPGAATVVTKDNGGGYVPTPENPSVVVPSEKTLVKDPSNLTEEEKAAVKEKVEKANPGKVVSVDEKGNVTVTDPQSGKTVTISADKLVVKQGNGVSLDKAVSEIKGRLASTGLNSTEGASLGFAALLAGLVLAARKRKENK